MRVLLLLYGHYRTFDRTLPSWLSSLEGCEFVCRFVTFDTIDHATKCWWHGNIEEHPKLTPAQIELLTTYDPNVRILSQTFSKEELDDIYATLPFKVYMYKYTNIKEMLESIDETQYDMILISRFDITIRTIRFKDISIKPDEIAIGGRLSPKFYKGLAASDLLCAFHPTNKHFFYNMPNDMRMRTFTVPEECYSDFLYTHFKVVHHIWKYSTDFYIEKDNVLPNRPVVRSRFG